MAKKVMIAEKPSVAEEYAKALNVPYSSDDKKRGYFMSDDWVITWSYGHLITMSYPEKYDPKLKKWEIETLPFIPNSYKYEVISNVKQQFNVVKEIYNSKLCPIDEIILAGDSGREGLYIQCLILQEAGHTKDVPVTVLWIDSQTQAEILKGVRERKPINAYTGMINSGYMRAIEDYLIGINFSRILSILYKNLIKNAASLSKAVPAQIGRVMTCVLGMVVDRERAIKEFKPTDFYKIAADVNGVSLEWKAVEGSKFFESPLLYSETGFKEEKDAISLMNSLGNELLCVKKETSRENKAAPLLYSLAELQGDCTKKLSVKLSPSETLDIAQSLYEKKLTTYPRTDARVLTTAIEKDIYNNIKGLTKGDFKEIADDILTNKRTVGKKYVDDSKVTDHYAIIPTGNTPRDLSDIEREVYELIVRRFLSIFYPPAVYEKTSVQLKNGSESFFTSGKKLIDKGYFVVAGLPDTKDVDLSGFNENSSYSGKYEIKKGETKAPTRYTTGSIILAMENAGKLIEDEALREQIKESGIGTSATRGDIIDKLIDIGYIASNKKTQAVSSTVLGEIIYEIVKATVPTLLKPNMTASWEKGLSQIAEGKIRKSDYEVKLYSFVSSNIDKLKADSEEKVVMDAIKTIATGEISNERKSIKDQYKESYVCPCCGGTLNNTNFTYECTCGLKVQKYLGRQWIPADEIERLLSTGETIYFKGLKTKEGKTYSAKMVLNKAENKVDLAFAPKKRSSKGRGGSKYSVPKRR